MDNTTVNAVYNYMKMQNRPYSVNDLLCNLPNEYGKATVQKATDQLVMDGKLFEKIYGKQKIYCIVQECIYDSDELTSIAKKLQAHAVEVENKYQEIKTEMEEEEALLSSLKSSLSLEDARREKLAIEENVKRLTLRLDHLMETTVCKDLRESKRKAQKELDDYSREYSKRKRLCMEIIDCILESYPGSKNDLYDEVGIDSAIVPSM